MVAALRRHAVDFIVIGGVAAQLHGWDGTTNDLDITVATDADNRKRLDAALASLGARPDGVGPNGTAFQTRHGRLEILSRTDGPPDFDAWAVRAREQVIGRGLVVAVADADDILRSKEAANREKDLRTLPGLRRTFLERRLISADDLRGEVADPAEHPPGEADPAIVAEIGMPPGIDDPAGLLMWQDAAAKLAASWADPGYVGDSAAARRRRAELARAVKKVRDLRRR